MAELLAQWLNEEVGLSKTVSNFEDDFASGYLFGELLYKFNQLSDFHNFSTKNATSHYVMNYEKLEPTLRSLNVQFTSKTVEKIMSRERGQALRLLYQLKMVLEKVYPPADISIVAKTGTFGDNQPAQRIAFSKPKYDEVTHNFFKSRLGKLNRAQKDIDLENHLQKFDDERVRQATQAAKLDNTDLQKDAKAKQEMRRIQINKLQRNAGFMEEWLSKGVEDWKANMTVKREREATQLEFQFTQAEKYNRIAQQKLKEAQDEVFDGIDNFEKNLKARGINTEVTMAEAHKAVDATLQGNTWKGNATVTSAVGTAAEMTIAKTFDPKASTKKGNFTLTSTGLKHRTKKTVTDESRKEREKRRRRLINQQATLMVNLQQASREQLVTNLMRRQSRQEKELDYEAWRTTQCKNIIIENRQLREVQYKERRKYDVELGVFKEEKLLSEMQDASNREIDQMVQRTTELKQYEQQYKLKQRSELCKGLMDAIFDIADEAYNHMQDLDSSQWDSRNWQNWLELFVNQQKISGTMAELLPSEQVGGDSAAQDQLDESELRDYCQNQNQWPTTLVSDVHLNLADVLNPKVETAAPAKGAKAGGKAPAQAEVVLEEGDLEVSDKPANNFIFGDVIDQLIKLHYPPRPQLKHPQTPNWLALKVCLVGKPHSWTKEQTAQLQARYGVDVFEMEKLVKDALEYSDSTEYSALPAPETAEGSDFEDLSQDESSAPDLNEQMRAISDEIREQLLNGEEISDELYVRLFVHKLRTTYEYKCPVTKRREVKVKAQRLVQINTRVALIAEELAKEDISKKLRKQLQEEQACLEIELADMDKLETKGWILVDFPCSYAQAKLLEEALSGFKPLEEQQPTDRELEIKKALELVKPSPQEQQAETLIKSGLDAIIWFECSTRECLKRAEGPRIDSLNPESQQYHVFNVVPPIDQAPLCERLLPINPVDDCVQGLPDRFVAFDQNTTSMQRWMKQFGDEQKDRILVNFVANENQADLDKNIEQVFNIFDRVLQHRVERYETLKDKLVTKYTEIEYERRLKQEEELQKQEQSIDSVAQAEDGAAARATPSLSTSKSKDLHRGKQRGSDAGINQNNQSLLQGASLESSSRVATFARDNVELEFRPTLIKLWQELSANYRGQMKRIFRNIRRFREQNFKQQSQTQQNFLKYIQRLDNKQELLDQFVRDFNAFTDEFPDLREDPQTKEELHQRCDVLSDELWEIVEERREQNIDERKKVMESGNTEHGLEFLTQSAQQLMQAELDKFKISIQILHDYYFAIEEKPTHEISGPLTSELIFEGDDVPAVEVVAEGQDANSIQSYSYPRLEKLLQLSLRQQVVPDVTQIQATADKDKKGGKAPPKKGASKEAEQETIVEESHYVKEMKEAIRIEKSILRFRLVQIRNWALDRLQTTRQTALNMYKKFDDWIQVAQKAEMDTIDEMCCIVKKAIEQEAKIQHELRIKFMDFSVNHTTLNYIDPPKPKLLALEEFVPSRFSIPMLQAIVAEFELISRSTGDLLQCRELVNLIYSKIKNGVQFGGVDTGFPEDWSQYGLAQIHQMVRNIDSKNSGFVNWRTLVTCFILVRSTVPSAKEVARIEKMLGDEATQDQVCQGSFWFDQSEKSTDRDYSIEFPRVHLVKQLLHRVHASGEKRMSVARLATTLGAIAHKAPSEKSTFFDVLFARVKI